MATSASNISGTGPEKLLLIWQVRSLCSKGNFCVGYFVKIVKPNYLISSLQRMDRAFHFLIIEIIML